MLVDVHAHLEELKGTKIPDNMLIVTNGTNPDTNRKAVLLSKGHSNVKYALGIYPSFAIEMSEMEIEKEIKFIRGQFAKRERPVALGEIGLDFTYPGREKQIAVFKRFIAISKEMNCPLIVHSRKAEKEVVEILKAENACKVVLHCFSGNLRIAREAEKLGFYFSIPAIIAYSSHFQELVKEVSLSRLLTETDSPYLSPVKGKENSPVNVEVAVKEIAKLKGITKEECEKIIFANFQRLFGS